MLEIGFSAAAFAPDLRSVLSAAVAGYSYIVVPEHNAYVDAFLTERFGSCTEDVYSVT